MVIMGRRKKEEGRRKKEEGRRKKGEGRRDEARREKEEGRDCLLELCVRRRVCLHVGDVVARCSLLAAAAAALNPKP
jgi:hypothetical protein